MKKTFMVSKKWFVIPLVISVIPVITVLLGNQGMASLSLPLAGVFNFAVYYAIYVVFGKIRTRVYSENTEVNIALNHIYKREWSVCILVLALFSSIFFTWMSYMAPNMAWHIQTIIIFPYAFFVMFAVFRAYSRVRAERNRMLCAMNETMYTDDDLLWRGMVYNNPNDSNTLVEKRMGYGFTVNMATKGGKAVIASIVFAAAIWLGIALYIVPFDFGAVSFEISEHNATIHAPFRRHSFSTNDIVSVAMIEDFPSATRINAADGARLSVGRYRVSGYGASDVFIHHDTPPFIVIELNSGPVFLNGDSRERTQVIYNSLLSFQ